MKAEVVVAILAFVASGATRAVNPRVSNAGGVVKRNPPVAKAIARGVSPRRVPLARRVPDDDDGDDDSDWDDHDDDDWDDDDDDDDRVAVGGAPSTGGQAGFVKDGDDDDDFTDNDGIDTEDDFTDNDGIDTENDFTDNDGIDTEDEDGRPGIPGPTQPAEVVSGARDSKMAPGVLGAAAAVGIVAGLL